MDTHKTTMSDEAIDLLTDSLDRFLAAWDQVDEHGPPEISEFLPSCSKLRMEFLVELIKVDMELRWQEYALPKSLDEYCEEFQELQSVALPIDLIFEEYVCRLSVDEAVCISDYFERYPNQADGLRQFASQSPDINATVISSFDQSSAVFDLQAGEVIDDFDLIMLLGQGAFAKVFLARQISMQRLVAVKVSADHGTEPQTLAQLDHDYIVRVHDQRIVETPPARLLYMQYLPGGTLESVTKRVRMTPVEMRSGQLLIDVLDGTLESKGEISPSDSSLRQELSGKSWPEVVAWIGIRLAKALDYANRQGVLHRDLKPANVLLSAEGVPKLADFNISFSSSVAGTNPTAYFGGSLAYMSPEQLEACSPRHETQADELDGRSDLYSLGVLLWELLRGTRPFDDLGGGDLSGQTIDKMLERRSRGLSREQFAPDFAECPESLMRILEKLLQPNREQRWQNADELIEQLEMCLEPRARELIDPPAKSWRSKARHWVVATVLLLNLIPNGISAVGNFFYNQRAIFDEMAPGQTFETILGVINGIAFPVGISFVVILANQVKRGIRNPEASQESGLEQFALPCAREERVSPVKRLFATRQNANTNSKTTIIRESALLLGHRCAMICLLLWIIAGIAYPVAFQAIGIDVSASEYAHIVGSLVLFGLIATAYPFFGVTWYSVQVLYPALLQKGRGQRKDRQDLQKLKTYLRYYLIAAASIPLLSVAAITIVSVEMLQLAQLLCFGGLAAFAAAFWFYRQIEDDLDVFLRIRGRKR
ncbi:serine/threonine-protein kinase [Thalassoglobus polymorphus]|uniref:Serine/threonine-protein kinase PknB n=1 Tax=Thalassoglobus polymorphus TaxID=2527994 RepID=A0A517QJN7_9PLAN|nr:serine/threonine-protein kinase [Thalassoglobus polymorphus]QDT31815.1 Serine/threonine-protein kinase PknB [Thalassoglobus polymorphus]